MNFNQVAAFMKSRGKEPVLISAGGYRAPGEEVQIEGLALEDGVMVGQNIPKPELNGLLVIQNGSPEIRHLNQITNVPEFLDNLKRSKADLFQQTSFVRPGGQFRSSNANRYELSFLWKER